MAGRKSPSGKSSPLFASWVYVFQDFGRAWLSYGLLAVIVAGITHGIFHVPMWEVTDVILALLLFAVAFVACLTAIAMCLDVAGGELMVAFARVISLVLLAFLPFGAILGFMAYDFFAETDFEAGSFVYKGFVAFFADGYAWLSSVVGDFLGIVRPMKEAVAPVPVLDQARLLMVAQIASVALALFGFALSRSRVTVLADDTLRFSPFAVLKN
ncbi:MAG: hypothetical protein ABL973_06360 [Micropepsaceae bacterium]